MKIILLKKPTPKPETIDIEDLEEDGGNVYGFLDELGSKCLLLFSGNRNRSWFILTRDYLNLNQIDETALEWIAKHELDAVVFETEDEAMTWFK
jgi:hypothetical protein